MFNVTEVVRLSLQMGEALPQLVVGVVTSSCTTQQNDKA